MCAASRYSGTKRIFALTTPSLLRKDNADRHEAKTWIPGRQAIHAAKLTSRVNRTGK